MHFNFQSTVASITVLNTRSGGFLYSSFPTDAQSLPSSTSPARDTRLLRSVSLRRHVVSTGIHSLRYGSSRHGTSARFVTCIMTDVHHCPFIQWPKHPLCSACLPLHPTALVNQGSFYCLCGKHKCRRSVVELASLP